MPFIPYIGEVAELMTALLRYKYHMEIRTAAVECMPEVCAFASATATYWPMCLCVIEAYA